MDKLMRDRINSDPEIVALLQEKAELTKQLEQHEAEKAFQCMLKRAKDDLRKENTAMRRKLGQYVRTYHIGVGANKRETTMQEIKAKHRAAEPGMRYCPYKDHYVPKDEFGNSASYCKPCNTENARRLAEGRER